MADTGALAAMSLTPTAALAGHLIAMRSAPPPTEALTVAKQCLLDWLGAASAGRAEPLVGMLAEEFAARDGDCTVIGLVRRASLDHAALINGAMGHALDFDDVITVVGHPTAPVAPAVLAQAEASGATGAEAVAAFIAGVEAECRVGRLMGPSHYAKGWHGTATFGTFGAAAAVGHLLDLDAAAMAHAIGIAGTQAAGLKSVFGTMSKPLHAGKAAQSGLMAARLAARGFTSDTDILGSAQGFAATQSTTVDVAAGLAPRPLPWVVEALFKYHAACYLTHNAIEAAAALRAETPFTAADVADVIVRVQGVHMGVCNIEAPRTGLECKFSLRMTCALALSGEDTFDDTLYSDVTAARPDLVALRQRVVVEPNAKTAGSTVEVRLNDGRTLTRTVDVAIPVCDLAAQQAKLERKFRHIVRNALTPEAAERVIVLCRGLEQAPDVRGLLAACAG
ncbi:MAG: MmgE/PrpD family protein [Phenylobacterium sp.]